MPRIMNPDHRQPTSWEDRWYAQYEARQLIAELKDQIGKVAFERWEAENLPAGLPWPQVCSRVRNRLQDIDFEQDVLLMGGPDLGEDDSWEWPGEYPAVQ